MRCGSCAFEAAVDFAFCPKCGRKLESACPSCRFACPPDFAFCPKCGTRVGQPVEARSPAPDSAVPTTDERLATLQEFMPAELADKVRAASLGDAASTDSERRPVTVLFADISGFTALSEVLDPEEVAVMIDRCLRVMADAVYRYEGTIDKYIGDCAMALFGAPVAHEDDPVRAIRAALVMRNHIAAIDADLKQETPRHGRAEPPTLSLHIGINTGTVVAGTVGGDRRREYTVLGDAVNVASRLESAAGSGEIVVGERTFRLAGPAFHFEDAGKLTLKGKSKPLQAYRVMGVATQIQPHHGGLEMLGLTSPMIGRDEELDRLTAAVREAVKGQTQLVSVIGDAGMGKSRLLRELATRSEVEGIIESHHVAVYRIWCSSLGEQPFGIAASFVRDACGIAADDTAATAQAKIVASLATMGARSEEIDRAVPLLGHLLGFDFAGNALRHIEPEQLKRQIFLAVRAVVELSLRSRPLLLVVEDLHWADAASVELLRFLTDRMSEERLMLLLSYRPSFDPSLLAQTRSAHLSIDLPRLSAAGMQALLAAFFDPATSRIPENVRDLVVDRTGGNPFYAEEIIRGLIEDGTLVRETDGWLCSLDGRKVEVPPSVQGLLLARLDRLPTRARRFAQEVAVLGPEFGTGMLPLVSSDVGRANANLIDLCNAGVLEPQPATAREPEHRYRFSHVLIREVAYESMLLRRRTELHGRVASVLEEGLGSRPERLEDLEVLGHHYSLSSNKSKGAHYLGAAGDWARNLYANDDAARYYRRAFEALEGCATETCWEERLGLRERLGDVLGRLGRREDALAHYREALAGYEEDGERPAQARLRRKIGSLQWESGDREAALAQYQTGLELLNGHTRHIELAHLYQEMGRLAFRSGENQAAIEWAQRALEIAEDLAGQSDRPQEAATAMAHAYNTLGVALARAARLEEAVEYVECSISVAQEYDLPQAACRAYTNLGVLYTNLDPGQAIEMCTAGLDLAKKIGDLGLQSWLYANLAGAYCTFTGQCEAEGIAAAEAAIELDQQLGQLDHLAVPLIVLGQIYQCHGDPEAALVSYQEALRLATEMREPQLLFPCYDGLATLYLEAGDVARAEEFMTTGEQVCAEAGLDVESLVMMPFLY